MRRLGVAVRAVLLGVLVYAAILQMAAVDIDPIGWKGTKDAPKARVFIYEAY